MIAAIAALVRMRAAEPDAGRDGDSELVARHLAGDPAAFATMYRTHVAAVYRRLGRILGPVAERDDLTQDVFLALHRALAGFRGDARLATLIHRIAINKACEFLRRRSRRPTTPTDARFFEELRAVTATPEERVIASDELARVFACLARIKPKKRVALLLRIVDGLSFEDIAQLVDATPEAVAKRVQHGQRELEALLDRAAGRRRP